MAIDREINPFLRHEPHPAVDLVDQLRQDSLDGGWLNLEPGITPEVAAAHERTPLGRMFSGRGPAIPSITITRSDSALSVGIEHGSGPHAIEQLKDVGLLLPDGWTTVQDHARRGLVFSAGPTVHSLNVVQFSTDVVHALTKVPIYEEWFIAVVRRT